MKVASLIASIESMTMDWDLSITQIAGRIILVWAYNIRMIFSGERMEESQIESKVVKDKKKQERLLFVVRFTQASQ